MEEKEAVAWWRTSTLKLFVTVALAVCGLAAVTTREPVLVPTVAAEKVKVLVLAAVSAQLVPAPEAVTFPAPTKV